DKHAEVISKLRNHGAEISEEQRHHGPKPYILPDFNRLGFNYRMTDLQGAVGVVQMGKLDHLIEERNKWAKYYISELSDIEWLQLPLVEEGYKHGWQSFTTLVKHGAPMNRNEIMEKLQEEGISTRPGTHAVHMLNYYREKYDLKSGDYAGAQIANDHSMAIPLHNRMVKEDFDYIINVLRSL
ncbi:MAG: DegT/DnrJ/EryC1/StrS family aminotransferase, partial [Bacteroidetes bacterium]|nr:DegT/DnrJ/EryC1/StrS family aminotransferase [Bacteroidota bacterium]